MPDHKRNDDGRDPAHQTGEDHGKIKKPQRTDATMTETDVARGSEPATRAQARGG